MSRRVTLFQRRDPMDAHTGSRSSPTCNRHAHVCRSTVASEQVPEFGRAAMTEDRADATGDNRRHPNALVAQTRVPDGVDAAMDPVQPSRCNPTCDCAAVEPARSELVDRSDPVLPCGNPGDGSVRPPRDVLLSHTEIKASIAPIRPSPGAIASAR